jgi:hypothetical protein
MRVCGSGFWVFGFFGSRSLLGFGREVLGLGFGVLISWVLEFRIRSEGLVFQVWGLQVWWFGF